MEYTKIHDLINYVSELFPEGDVKITIDSDSRDWYTKVCDKLDDCTFVELVDKLKVLVDLNEFDRMLSADELSTEEHDKCESWIELSMSFIKDIVTDKIENLQEVLDMI